MPKGAKPTPEDRRKLEDDDKPLDRLIGRGAPKRQVRLVGDPATGKMGLLMALRPQVATLLDDGVALIRHEELLPATVTIGPGFTFRPAVTVEVKIALNAAQMADYVRYVESLRMPQEPHSPP